MNTSDGFACDGNPPQRGDHFRFRRVRTLEGLDHTVGSPARAEDLIRIGREQSETLFVIGLAAESGNRQNKRRRERRTGGQSRTCG